MPDIEITIGAETSGFTRGTRAASAEATRFGRTMRETGQAAERGAGRGIDRASTAVQQFGKQSDRTQTQTARLAGSVTKLAVQFSLVDRAVGQVLNGIKALNRGFQGGLAGGVRRGLEFESVTARMTTMFGSAEKAAAVRGEVQRIAKLTPESLSGVAQATATMSAFMGKSRDAVTGLIPVLADVASYMKRDITEAASAMGRAFAAGAGAADIFRETGVLGAITDFAGGLDLTKLKIGEFRKVMVQAFMDPSSGIAGAAEAVSKTVGGSLRNMQDEFEIMQRSLLDSTLPAVGKIGKAMSEVFEGVTDRVTGSKGLEAAVGSIASALDRNKDSIVSALVEIAEAAGRMSKAIAELPWNRIVSLLTLNAGKTDAQQALTRTEGTIRKRTALLERASKPLDFSIQGIFGRQEARARIRELEPGPGGFEGAAARVRADLIGLTEYAATLRAEIQAVADAEKARSTAAAANRQNERDVLQELQAAGAFNENMRGRREAIVKAAARFSRRGGPISMGERDIALPFDSPAPRGVKQVVGSLRDIAEEFGGTLETAAKASHELDDFWKKAHNTWVAMGSRDPVRMGPGLDVPQATVFREMARRQGSKEAAMAAAFGAPGPGQIMSGQIQMQANRVTFLRKEAAAAGMATKQSSVLAMSYAELRSEAESLSEALHRSGERLRVVGERTEGATRRWVAFQQATIQRQAVAGPTSQFAANIAGVMRQLDADRQNPNMDPTGAKGLAAARVVQAVPGEGAWAQFAQGAGRVGGAAALGAMTGGPVGAVIGGGVQLGIELLGVLDRANAVAKKLAESIKGSFQGIGDIISSGIRDGLSDTAIFDAVDKFVNHMVLQLATVRVAEEILKDPLSTLASAFVSKDSPQQVFARQRGGSAAQATGIATITASERRRAAMEDLGAASRDLYDAIQELNRNFDRGLSIRATDQAVTLGALKGNRLADAGDEARAAGLRVSVISGATRDILVEAFAKQVSVMEQVRDALYTIRDLMGAGQQLVGVAPGQMGAGGMDDRMGQEFERELNERGAA